MSDSAALDGFLDKWRLRWPEWRVLEVFLPAGQRPVAVAWFTLLQEFEDAMNIAGDPLPADAKLGWWGEELRDWTRRRSRHPLGRVLEPRQLDWDPIAQALPQLVLARNRPLDREGAAATLAPLAQAIAVIEAGLFGMPQAVAPEAAVAAINARLLAARLASGMAEAVPMRIDGRPGVPDAWAGSVLQAWPRDHAGSLPRRLFSALGRSRLARSPAGAPAVPLRPVQALWLGWRAARH